MGTLHQLQYRTMDELLNSVMTDFSSYTMEDQIEPAELIKVAQKCNWQLGLKINQTKEAILDINHGRAKLPADFYSLNLALLCGHYNTITPSIANGIQSHDVVVSQTSGDTCTQCNTIHIGDCIITDSDPWFRNKVYTLCNNSVEVRVIQECKFEVREYTHFDRIYMVPSRQASSFCLNTQFRDCANKGQIKNGFLEMLGNDNYNRAYSSDTVPHQGGIDNWGYPNSGYSDRFRTGTVYVCYEGQMEDDQGNLLVIDHPVINEFLEYSLKERIMENLYLNGEPDIERRLTLVQNKLKVARIEAMSIVNTPDYSEMRNTTDANRLDMNSKYIKPFEKLLYPYTY